MRSLLAFLPVLCLSGCVIAGGDGTGFHYVAVGADASGLRAAPDGLTADSLNTGESLRAVSKDARILGQTVVVAGALESVGNGVTSAVKSVKNARTAATVSKDASAAAVEEKRIAADLARKVAELNAMNGQ